MTAEQIKNPEDILKEISKDNLLEEVLILKNKGLRLSQACAALIEGKLELSYSFMDDETNQFTTLRVVVETGEPVPSISEVLPAAIFYENEMKELFGVNIKMISLDYDDKLYRIDAETPFNPGAKDIIKAAEDAKAGAADEAEAEVPDTENEGKEEKEDVK